jgi:general secretion pathway protein G
MLQKELGNDPWGHPYLYKYPGEHGEDPDVMSYGADGKPGGTGNDADIVSWK